MPQLRLDPEQLEVTSFAPMPVRASEKREMARATLVYPRQTCEYQSCVYACASNTCPALCV